ncbi:MAG TPA: rhodanese-like domain-containing protein [Methanothrix sp.]|nr:rhodanese-like domain-containing protein [Methanothrix sp.]
MIKMKLNAIGIIFISLLATASVAYAGCSCSVGNWDPSAFLNSEDGTGHSEQHSSSGDSAVGDSGSGTQKPVDRVSSFPNRELFKGLKSVSSSDVVIDVSNSDSYSASHIKNAIHIPSNDLLNSEGRLKAADELSGVFGNAGLSREDSVVLYADKESSGEAEFVYLVLRYLGQKDVRLLDGNLADWKAAGLPEEASDNILPAKEYKPSLRPEVIADYQYVKSGKAHIIDVRPFVDFGKGRIPGSIALDPSNVIRGDKIKTSNGLSTVFSRLDKEKPIVVYSDDYSRSALAAFALLLMGYNASIYSWEDWKANEEVVEKAGAANTQTGTTPAAGDAAGSRYTKLGTT